MLSRLGRNLRTFLWALVLGLSVWVAAVTAADPDEVRLYPNAVSLELVGQDPASSSPAMSRRTCNSRYAPRDPFGIN